MPKQESQQPQYAPQPDPNAQYGPAPQPHNTVPHHNRRIRRMSSNQSASNILHSLKQRQCNMS